jgi:hypothetical protein
LKAFRRPGMVLPTCIPHLASCSLCPRVSWLLSSHALLRLARRPVALALRATYITDTASDLEVRGRRPCGRPDQLMRAAEPAAAAELVRQLPEHAMSRCRRRLRAPAAHRLGYWVAYYTRTLAGSVHRTHNTSQPDTAGIPTPRRCLPLYAAAACRSALSIAQRIFSGDHLIFDFKRCSFILPSSEGTPSTVSDSSYIVLPLHSLASSLRSSSFLQLARSVNLFISLLRF